MHTRYFIIRNLAAFQVQTYPLNPAMTSNSIVSLPFVTLDSQDDFFFPKCDLSMLAFVTRMHMLVVFQLSFCFVAKPFAFIWISLPSYLLTGHPSKSLCFCMTSHPVTFFLRKNDFAVPLSICYTSSKL